LTGTFANNSKNFRNRPPAIFLFTLVLTIFATVTPLEAQWLPDRESELLVQKGIEHVYNLELDSALVLFNRVVEKHPTHPSGFFFVAMVDWMRILNDRENTAHDDEFFSKLEIVIDYADGMLGLDKNNLSALFFKGGAIGFRGRLRAHRGMWVRAANDGRRALPIVRRAERLAPDNADVLLGTGIYNYYAAVIPETYPWVKPFMLFFPSGDREEGLQQLRNAAENARYAGIEAAYFLMQILYFNEKNYGEGYTLAKELTERFPQNPLFKRYYGRFAVALNRWNTGYEVFTEVKQHFDDGVFGYSLPAGREANYYIGQYLFHRNEYEEALDYYSEVIRISNELDQDSQSGFMILATLRRGMIFDALGERDRALQEYRTVRSLDDYQGSRKLAERYMEIPYSTGRTVQEINPNRFSP
jgi:hypothetical protein